MFFSEILQTIWSPWQPKYKIEEIQLNCMIPHARLHCNAKFEVSISNSLKIIDKRMFFTKHLQTIWSPWQPKYKIEEIQFHCMIPYANLHFHAKFEVTISNSSKVFDKRMVFSEMLQTIWFPWQPKYKIEEIQFHCMIPHANLHFHAKIEVSFSNNTKAIDKRMFFSEILQTIWFPWQLKNKIEEIQLNCMIPSANLQFYAKFEVSISNSSKVFDKRMFFSEILPAIMFPW